MRPRVHCTPALRVLNFLPKERGREGGRGGGGGQDLYVLTLQETRPFSFLGRIVETRTAGWDNGEGLERVEVKRQLGDQFALLERRRTLGTGEETLLKTSHNLPNEVGAGTYPPPPPPHPTSHGPYRIPNPLLRLGLGRGELLPGQ